MSARSDSETLLLVLNRIADRFSGRPDWRHLAERVATTLSKRVDSDSGTTSSEPPGSPGGQCVCCGRRAVSGSHGLCDRCQRLYAPHTARVIADEMAGLVQRAGPGADRRVAERRFASLRVHGCI